MLNWQCLAKLCCNVAFRCYCKLTALRACMLTEISLALRTRQRVNCPVGGTAVSRPASRSNCVSHRQASEGMTQQPRGISEIWEPIGAQDKRQGRAAWKSPCQRLGTQRLCNTDAPCKRTIVFNAERACAELSPLFCQNRQAIKRDGLTSSSLAVFLRTGRRGQANGQN